ncbi:MAG TPA: MraY family glycosyltransferase [Bacteroidia bacterium]|nr:MraY family glycosyltransferase [Bacteroidia bacterium]HNT79347.1 MraY family glycosyltransferase [Bacteroidia bacterium]
MDVPILSKIILPALMAYIICFAWMPMWLKVCTRWNLFDTPDERKQHANHTPNMGGIAIFIGTFVSFFIFSAFYQTPASGYLSAALMIMFFTGFFDDLLNIEALSKLFLQILAALLIVAGDIKIVSFYGLFGINEIAPMFQIPLTLLFVVSFTNAFNLIDGIDGLAGVLGVIMASVFGVMFYTAGNYTYTCLCFCVAGSLLSFLAFNLHPAKVFMGDTGSMIIGFMMAVMAIELLNQPFGNTLNSLEVSKLVFATLFVPIYDLIRVSIIRLIEKRSPLMADRNHLHHMILRNGFRQTGTVFLIAFVNLTLIFFSIMAPSVGINSMIILSFLTCILFLNTFSLHLIHRMYGRLIGIDSKQAAQISSFRF